MYTTIFLFLKTLENGIHTNIIKQQIKITFLLLCTLKPCSKSGINKYTAIIIIIIIMCVFISETTKRGIM